MVNKKKNGQLAGSRLSSTGPRQQIFILPVDAIWSCRSCIYLELKDIFEEIKQGFDDESRNLTHFNALEEYMALGISTKL